MNTNEFLTQDEAAKYFAGCALTGFCSEVRLGRSISEQEMRAMVDRAAQIGWLLSQRMVG